MTEKELEGIVDELMPRLIEDAVREALSEKRGLIESIAEAKDFEIDGYLLKFKKPEIALEVKWKKIGEKEISQIEEKLGKLDASQKILFVQDKNKIRSKLKVMDTEDLLP